MKPPSASPSVRTVFSRGIINSRPLRRSLANASMAQRGTTMTPRAEFRRLATLALPAAIAVTLFNATPARADRCDDLAAQLANQIDGIKVGITAAKVIYLSHPQAKELSLGCSNRKFS